MSKVLVEESNLTAIASAVRQKLGVQTTYKPGQMATAIGTIHGEPVLETLSATANGSYSPSTGKDGFSVVTVNVPNTYAAADEGKVVQNAALVAQTARAADITANGTYDTTTNDEVTVNVSGGGYPEPTGTIPITQNGTHNVKDYASAAVSVQPVLQSKTVAQNGTVTPDSGYDGLSSVVVNVQGGGNPPGLPNSIQANILSSAYLGNFVDTSTPWDGFVFYNGASAFASQNYMYLASNSYIEYDLGASKSVTIYFVGACTDYSSNYPTLFGLIYAASNGNIAVVNSYSGIAHFSRFGSELSGMPVISTLVEHCWTIAVNAEAKTAKLYADGQYIGVLTLNNVGQYIRVATVTSTQYQGNVLVDYLGVVKGEEAAETIVANQQSLMTVFGISGGSA